MMLWKPVARGPSARFLDNRLRQIYQLATAHSLKDRRSIGAALLKYHQFCDSFAIAEEDRCPAKPDLLRSFAMWAAAPPSLALGHEISVSSVRNYLAGVTAWHEAHGYAAPLDDAAHKAIGRTLRGLANLEPTERAALARPPVLFQHLAIIHSSLDTCNAFDIAFWAACAVAFFGLARPGEVTVRSQGAFSPSKHATGADYTSALDLEGAPIATVRLPSAKTSGSSLKDQRLSLTSQLPEICPLRALRQQMKFNRPSAGDHLFSWRSTSGAAIPLTYSAFGKKLRAIYKAKDLGHIFPHSFRIGGASFFLAKGVDPEIVRLLGRWASLSFSMYIRSFELVAPRHLAMAHTR